jgi:hypothetical protein
VLDAAAQAASVRRHLIRADLHARGGDLGLGLRHVVSGSRPAARLPPDQDRLDL